MYEERDVLDDEDLSDDEVEDGDDTDGERVNPLCPGVDIPRERRIVLCKPW